MEKQMGRLVCELNINGEDVVKVLTTAPNINLGSFVRMVPGIGKPFWYFESIPAPNPAGCDFTDAPIVSENISQNNAAIAAITVDPADVLFYV